MGGVHKFLLLSGFHTLTPRMEGRTAYKICPCSHVAYTCLPLLLSLLCHHTMCFIYYFFVKVRVKLFATEIKDASLCETQDFHLFVAVLFRQDAGILVALCLYISFTFIYI